MGTRDPRVDAYIAKSADFARPVLTYLREMVHTACPDVEESLKCGCPHFMYDGMLGGMAAFKQHCTFGYWKGALIVETPADEKVMGQFGRITSIGDLPPKSVLMRYTKRAMKLNQSGAKIARPRSRAAKKTLAIPDDLAAALAKHAKARKTFEQFPPSQKREYIEWITEAKRDETRQRRLATTLEWLAEGKRRNWKYM